MPTKKLQIIGNLGGNSIEIDDTLTQAGKAADAKATGDAINQMQTSIDEFQVHVNQINESIANKQDVLTGAEGQIIQFDEQGKPVAVDFNLEEITNETIDAICGEEIEVAEDVMF